MKTKQLILLLSTFFVNVFTVLAGDNIPVVLPTKISQTQQLIQQLMLYLLLGIGILIIILMILIVIKIWISNKKSTNKILMGIGIGFIIALLNSVIGVLMRRTIGLRFHPYLWLIMKIINCTGAWFCIVVYSFAILLSFPIFMLIGAFIAALWGYKR